MESKIKTWEDACNLLNRDPNALPEVSKLPEDEGEYIIANYKLTVITKALNKEYSDNNNLSKTWTPDYYNRNYKYTPWFEVKATKDNTSGSGFSRTDCDCWHTHTSVGSRLCLPTSQLAIYIGIQFEDLQIKSQLMKD